MDNDVMLRLKALVFDGQTLEAIGWETIHWREKSKHYRIGSVQTLFIWYRCNTSNYGINELVYFRYIRIETWFHISPTLSILLTTITYINWCTNTSRMLVTDESKHWMHSVYFPSIFVCLSLTPSSQIVIYINDLLDVLQYNSAYIYEDDTAMLVTAKNPFDINHHLNIYATYYPTMMTFWVGEGGVVEILFLPLLRCFSHWAWEVWFCCIFHKYLFTRLSNKHHGLKARTPRGRRSVCSSQLSD